MQSARRSTIGSVRQGAKATPSALAHLTIRSMPAQTRVLYFFLIAFCAAAVTASGQNSAKPATAAPPDPASLPARDSHQGLLVAADPFTSADRYREKFGKHTPYE